MSIVIALLLFPAGDGATQAAVKTGVAVKQLPAGNSFKVLQTSPFPQACSDNLVGITTLPPVTKTVNGVSFVVPLRKITLGGYVCILADMSDLRKKIGAIVDNVSWPTNNCASMPGPNYVVRVPNKTLLPSPLPDVTVMNFDASGDITAWSCVNNPIPNSKLEWVSKPFPGHFVLHTWPADPIKGQSPTTPWHEHLGFTLQPLAGNSGVMVYPTFQTNIPFVKVFVPAIDMSGLVKNALITSLPAIPSSGIPAFHIDGARYYMGSAEIWGTL